MKTPIILAFVALSLNCLSAPVPAPVAKVAESNYRAGEFNLDLYGFGTLKNEQRDKDDVKTGVGLGATYFITRGLGFGFRADSENAHHSFVDLLQARATFRAPLWDRVAPYGYVEGGYHFERDDWQAGSGGGLEYRFFRNVGVYAEAGLSVDMDGLGRMRGVAGLRLSF